MIKRQRMNGPPPDIQTDLVTKEVLGQVECQGKEREERLPKSKYFFAIVLWLEEIIIYL